MFCWRGVTPNVIPDSILGSKPSDSDSSTTTRRGDCAHDQPDPHPTPPGHTNHQRDRNTGLRTSRLGRAALHHLRHLRLPLPRRPPATPRPLPQLDPQGRRQDHHPTPQRRAAGPLPALVPSPLTPTRATHRTRDPLPGDHRDRTATSGRPQKAQPQTATKNTAHLGMLAWFGLQATATVYAVEADVVRARHLWPRSITQPPLTTADRRVLQDTAEVETRRPEQRVNVEFTAQADHDPLHQPELPTEKHRH